MQVTLPTKYTVYNLLTLLRALTGLTTRRQSCRFYSLQNDIANGGAHIYKGTALMTATPVTGPVANYDKELLSTIVYPQDSPHQDIDLGAVHLAASIDNAVVNVEFTDR